MDHLPLRCTLMKDRVHALARTIWHYHLMNHVLERADAILVLCSHDERVAERGAEDTGQDRYC